MRPLLSFAVFVALLGSVPAQNCTNTSLPGFVPLNELGAGSYQGYPGGLYPGGKNTMPIGHFVEGLDRAAAIEPRAATGAPSGTGKIVFLSIGMSNCTQEFSAFMPLSDADTLRDTSIVCVDGAQGGQTSSLIQDPGAEFWTIVDERLAAAGCTREQVQVIWFKETDAGPTGGFPAFAQVLRAEFETILNLIVARFPNVQICYLASRIYAGYATSALNPEPYAYEQGFSCKWLIEDQIEGDPGLNYDPSVGPVRAPWCAWGTYNWANGTTPRGDGLTWVCSDFGADGTHPSTSGRTKVAQALLDFLRTDPIASAWYLRAPPPYAYGTGKTSSLGKAPTLSWNGNPSAGSSNFRLVLGDGVPLTSALLFYGDHADAVPFINATRWVGSPLLRLEPHTLNGGGSSTWSIPIDASMVGRSRFYQSYSRDVQHPDGTGAIVSNGLRVVFSN